jgi:hypothetical protein
MESKDWNLWNNITFKTVNYYKNYDIAVINDNIITEHSGEISEIRIHEDKPPVIIGQFGISVWDIPLANKLNIDVYQLLRGHKTENIYDELMEIITKKQFDVFKYDKLVLISGIVLRPDYRKRGMMEEFIEFIYRGFYSERNAIIALVKPLQENPIDIDFFLNHSYVEVRKVMKDYHNVEMIPARTYYSIDELYKNTDKEMNEYKLFAIASKCGFNRLGNSHLFQLLPDKIFQRILEKREIVQKNNGVK